MLIESIGFAYTQKIARTNTVTWWCSVRSNKRRCPATVLQRGNDFRRGSQHNHPADIGVVHTVKLAKQAKDAAKIHIFKPAKSLIETAYQNNVTEGDFNLPNTDNLARRVNRCRQAMRPKEPREIDFNLVENAIPEDFLRFDITMEGARHLVMATDKQLSLLKQTKTWYVDATFKILRPADPFSQLFSIHSFVKNETGDTKQVPLLYVFMSRRSKKDYKKVMKKVKSLTQPSRVKEFVLEFESATWAALRKVYLDASLRGCAFHWSQAVWRKVQNLGLATDFQRRESTHKFVRKLLALPLLPTEHIGPAFDNLVDKASDALRPLVDYVQQTWISGSWGQSDWSVYGQSVRTNNDCEGWHRRLNVRNATPPPFYSLVTLLHKESLYVELQVRLVSEKKLKKLQRKSTRLMQSKIFGAWDAYMTGSLSTSKLLKKLSAVYSPYLE